MTVRPRSHIDPTGPDTLLAPGVRGPARLTLAIPEWRGLELCLDVVAGRDGYVCRSITITRPDGAIDYAAFRLVPIETVLRHTATALRLVLPGGDAVPWPLTSEHSEALRATARADRSQRVLLVQRVHALASFAGLAAREVVVDTLEVPTATVSRIIARARQDVQE